MNKTAFLCLYKALVRSVLEYNTMAVFFNVFTGMEPFGAFRLLMELM